MGEDAADAGGGALERANVLLRQRVQHFVATAGGEAVDAFPIDVLGLRYATKADGGRE